MPCDQANRIHIDGAVKTKQLLLATLAHEMVHQLQHEQGKATHHGKLFQYHAKRIQQLTGLVL